MPYIEDRPAVPARITFQTFSTLTGDCDYDHEVQIDDVSDALDAFELGELPFCAEDLIYGALDFGGDVYRELSDRRLVEEWDGPFELYLMDDEAYEEYRRWREEND